MKALARHLTSQCFEDLSKERGRFACSGIASQTPHFQTRVWVPLMLLVLGPHLEWQMFPLIWMNYLKLFLKLGSWYQQYHLIPMET